MKARYVLLITIILVIVVYLGNEQKGVLQSQEAIYQQQLFRNIDVVTIILSNSLPDTLNLYNSNFTEQELSLFKNSLGNITLALGTKWTELAEMERFYGKSNSFSKSVEDFYNQMFNIKENAGAIDEVVFYQMGNIIHEHGRELAEINYTSLQNVFEKGPKIFNEMSKEIQYLVKLKD